MMTGKKTYNQLKLRDIISFSISGLALLGCASALFIANENSVEAAKKPDLAASSASSASAVIKSTISDTPTVSDEVILLRTENLINRVEKVTKVRAVRVERTIPSVQIDGLVAVVVEVTLKGEQVESIVYTNRDATAFITGVVMRYNEEIYGMDFVSKSYAAAQNASKQLALSKALENDDYKPNPKKTEALKRGVSVYAGKQQADVSVGIESLQDGKNAADMITPKEELKVVQRVRKEKNPTQKTFSFHGQKITADGFWNGIMNDKLNYVEEGAAEAPLFYVFHDPWCPVCHRLYNDIRTLVSENKVRVRWVTIYGLNSHPQFAGETSFDAAYRITASEDKSAAFKEFMVNDNLPKKVKAINQKVLAELKFNIDVANFALNGRQVTPTVIWRGVGGLLGIRAGLTSEGLKTLAESGKVSIN